MTVAKFDWKSKTISWYECKSETVARAEWKSQGCQLGLTLAHLISFPPTFATDLIHLENQSLSQILLELEDEKLNNKKFMSLICVWWCIRFYTPFYFLGLLTSKRPKKPPLHLPPIFEPSFAGLGSQWKLLSDVSITYISYSNHIYLVYQSHIFIYQSHICIYVYTYMNEFNAGSEQVSPTHLSAQSSETNRQ